MSFAFAASPPSAKSIVMVYLMHMKLSAVILFWALSRAMEAAQLALRGTRKILSCGVRARYLGRETGWYNGALPALSWFKFDFI